MPMVGERDDVVLRRKREVGDPAEVVVGDVALILRAAGRDQRDPFVSTRVVDVRQTFAVMRPLRESVSDPAAGAVMHHRFFPQRHR